MQINYSNFLEFIVSNRWKSKSQISQDLFALYFTQQKKDGYFIEIGACDGKHLSNTFALEKKGWTGIICEPSRFWHQKMKKGAYIVNTARGKICNKNDIADALKSGQLSGYAGDVWFPQPAPNDHVWRSMPNHGMTPHTSGTSLSAQARYADGVREILECFFDKKPIRDQYLIVKDGQLAGMGAHSYSKGSATSGSEEAAKYKKK